MNSINKTLSAEAQQLLDYLEGRGLEPGEAAAVMGIAIASLIRTTAGLDSFITVLRESHSKRMEH